jgi:hypothetical protein
VVADQKECGIIESIFDGIVRITGLDYVFYSELLFSVNLNYNLDMLNIQNIDLSAEEIEEVIENLNDNEGDNLIARLANDFVIPFIFLNNKKIFTHFLENGYEDLSSNFTQAETNDAIPQFKGLNLISENFHILTEIFGSESLKINNITSSINFDLLADVQELFDDNALSDDLEIIAENLLNESYETEAEFLINYVNTIYPLITNIVFSSSISDKKELLTALKNYFYALIESGFNEENTSIIIESPLSSDLSEVDELAVDLNEEISITSKEDDEDTSSRTLMLIMGLERESIQAPMLTQTTELYEGDLAWRTSQELEIYCSIESLGRISDIFLNSLE